MTEFLQSTPVTIFALVCTILQIWLLIHLFSQNKKLKLQNKEIKYEIACIVLAASNHGIKFKIVGDENFSEPLAFKQADNIIKFERIDK